MAITFIPPYAIKELSESLKNADVSNMTARKCLVHAVKTVAIPSIRENFRTRGRGKWKMLSSITVDKKGHATILHETGKLGRAATAYARWKIRGNAAMFSISGSNAPYGFYHEVGTKYMPERNYAFLTKDDVDKISEIFGQEAEVSILRVLP